MLECHWMRVIEKTLIEIIRTDYGSNTNSEMFSLICQIVKLPKLCKKLQPYDKIFKTRKETFSTTRACTQPSFNH